jgi:hypothetical protein
LLAYHPYDAAVADCLVAFMQKGTSVGLSRRRSLAAENVGLEAGREAVVPPDLFAHGDPSLLSLITKGDDFFASLAGFRLPQQASRHRRSAC